MHARAATPHRGGGPDCRRSGILRDVSDPTSPSLPTDALQPALPGAPVVAHVVRGGFVESVHHGTAVVTAPDGASSWRSATRAERSSPQLEQAAPGARHGPARPRDERSLLALACASHSGEDFHVEAAREILAGAGLTEADLQNTPDYPVRRGRADRVDRDGQPKQSIAQNCSGKHASMLATCVVNGWDTATYRDPPTPCRSRSPRPCAR